MARSIAQSTPRMLRNFFDNLSAEDKAEFAKIKHPPRSDHDRYSSIFA